MSSEAEPWERDLRQVMMQSVLPACGTNLSGTTPWKQRKGGGGQLSARHDCQAMSHQHLPRTSIPNASLASLADRLLGSARSTFLSISWTPLTQLAEWAVLRTLGNLTKGVLRIVRQDGSVVQFPVALQPAPVSGPVAELRVVRDAFWLRLAFMGGLGFAEAYMFGDVGPAPARPGALRHALTGAGQVSCTPGDLRAMFRVRCLRRCGHV